MADLTVILQNCKEVLGEQVSNPGVVFQIDPAVNKLLSLEKVLKMTQVDCVSCHHVEPEAWESDYTLAQIDPPKTLGCEIGQKRQSKGDLSVV